MSSINEYGLGTDVICSTEFTTTAGAAHDPSAVFFQFKDPEGEITAYEYGQDTELVKDSTGNYHVNVDASKVGTWHYRFYATGTGKAADERVFKISPSAFE